MEPTVIIIKDNEARMGVWQPSLLMAANVVGNMDYTVCKTPIVIRLHQATLHLADARDTAPLLVTTAHLSCKIRWDMMCIFSQLIFGPQLQMSPNVINTKQL